MRRPDLTVLAIPAFVGAMAAELLWQRRNPAPAGTTRAGDYEVADTIASLTMGVGSLIAPFVAKKLLDPVTPGIGRGAKVLMGVAVAASAVTTVADVVRRRRADGALPGSRPNANLAPIEKGPFTAVEIVAGDLGTKGGVVTDVHARVLREDGSVIPGLYAAGNTSASVVGRTYPGPGSTLGPACVFGHVAALHLAGAADREPALTARP